VLHAPCYALWLRRPPYASPTGERPRIKLIHLPASTFPDLYTLLPRATIVPPPTPTHHQLPSTRSLRPLTAASAPTRRRSVALDSAARPLPKLLALALTRAVSLLVEVDAEDEAGRVEA
jgi:hypothetical protein